MPGDTVTHPGDPPDPVRQILRALESDPSALGEPLLVLGSGPIAVRGAVGAVLALDGRGAAVLIPVFPTLLPRAAAELSDELERLGQLSPRELASLATLPGRDGDLVTVHSEFFKLPPDTNAPLNAQQRAVVVLTGTPGVEAWRDLRADLGPALRGVFALEDGRLSPQPLPPAIAARLGARVQWRWVAAAAFVFFVLGFWLSRELDRPDAPQGSLPAVSAASFVAAQVGPDATHTQWVGQRRIARTSDGRLVAAYATGAGIQIVRDQANQGRSWEAPQVVPEIVPQSLAIAVGPDDRVHVAFRDGEGIGYVSLSAGPDGAIAGPVLRLDRASSSPVVDMAFDPSARIAHVVWVRGDADQQPVWAAISPVEGGPELIRSEPLAEPGDTLSVLVNIASAADGSLIATYRRGDSLEGWFARYLELPDPSNFVWSAEERLPTDEALYGAASLAVDRKGDAHLVLRDNTTYGLTYLRRSEGAWSPLETIVDAETTEEIDFPSLSPDGASDVVYAFFQDSQTTGSGRIKVAFRDPATGWTPPVAVESDDELLYPTSAPSAVGSAVFLATAQGPRQINAFRAAVG